MVKLRGLKRIIASSYRHLYGWARGEYHPPTGLVRFGDLRRLTPISLHFGYDRGQPIDRYYIEQFLSNYAADIKGHVLEIGDDTYTHRFGGRHVTISDVLHVTEDHPEATIVADLTDADHIQSNLFDCIILTQTLHLIYDMQTAVETIYRILRPGGTLLATFPGISQIDRGQWGNTWHWGFTTHSARRLFSKAFPDTNVCLRSYGNVLSAIAFLHGLASEELLQKELDYHDPYYELLVVARAVKPE